jgi:RNA polymerase sigma-70 factor, ECF subfamily
MKNQFDEILMTSHSCQCESETCIGAHMKDAGTPALDALIHACARGDRVAFKSLYEASSGRLFGGAMRLLRDHALAQDALQDGFLKIWRNAEKFDATKGAAMSWMSIIVRRAALDRLATRREHVDLDEIELAAPEIAPRDPGLDKCLQKLPDLHRKAIILSYVYGYNHDEIADMLQKPVGTIKSWVRRAGIALRECLQA